MNNLRGAKIIYQESKATQPSHLYFLQKDENYCDAIITSESGAKRKLNINVDLSNHYTKTEVNTLINSIDLSNYYTKNEVDVKLLDYYTKVEINSQFSNYYTKNEVDTALALKLDKGNYTGTAQDLKNDIETKQKKLSSFDESILVETDGNIEGNVSLFTEYFQQQVCELNFIPTQIIGVYKNGVKLLPEEFNITLPKKITIKTYSTEKIEIQYTHLKNK